MPGKTTTVADLAIAHPGALSVFNKYNIDYCCGGQRSIEEACARKGLDPEKIKEEIYASSVADSPHVLRPESWSSAFLIDYIVQVHHGYVRKAMPEILQLLDKVCDVHGSDSPELIDIREAFLDLPWFDHMHRYLPALMQRAGWKTVSVPVNHRHRASGVSKYNNLNRALVGIRDLRGVAWLIARNRRTATEEL